MMKGMAGSPMLGRYASSSSAWEELAKRILFSPIQVSSFLLQSCIACGLCKSPLATKHAALMIRSSVCMRKICALFICFAVARPTSHGPSTGLSKVPSVERCTRNQPVHLSLGVCFRLSWAVGKTGSAVLAHQGSASHAGSCRNDDMMVGPLMMMMMMT